jgi:hypothetical protein
MTKVTILKQVRNNQTLRQLDTEEVVATIKDQAFGKICSELRAVYPLAEVRMKYDADDGFLSYYTQDLP